MTTHKCKHEDRINKIDREQGETITAHKALVKRVDRLTQVAIAVGVVMLGNTLLFMGFLVSFWVERSGQ